MDDSLSSVDEEIGEPYCFESDHLALKSNPDYHTLLRTICILEAQRAKAISDLELLHEAQEKVLKDPIAFVDKLQHGADLELKLPAPQKIAQLPLIDWEKYTNSVDFSSLSSHRHSARLKNIGIDRSAEDESLMRLKSNLVGNNSSSGTSIAGDGDDSMQIVRGRLRDTNKSKTFNQLWTAEEQKQYALNISILHLSPRPKQVHRLEDCLVKYPPEEVEAKRWQKIAAALGNRTPQQVASRVQKYFIKLAKAGLPVPGRVPNVSAHMRRGHRHQRYNRLYYPQSTFLQSYEPPVYMNDDDERFDSFRENHFEPYSYAASEDRSSSHDNSDDEGLPEDVCNTPEYQELMQLKQLREEHLQSLDSSVQQHIGFKCDRCGCEPIVGTRWHCIDCPKDISLDFCDNCADGSFESGPHNSSHRIRPVKRARTSRSTQDQDYMRFVPGGYNYLDTNYMPAS